MDESDKLEQIGRAMQAAWSRVKKAQSRMWGDWMTIGEGLLEGRRWAMQMAGVNRPEGKGYVTAFGEWLTRWKVHDMDKSDRAKLLQLMEERPAVEEWRATLTDHDRRMLNHPVIVRRKWTAATRVKKPKSRTAAVSATEHGRAQVLIEQLRARLAEVEEERPVLDRQALHERLVELVRPLSREERIKAVDMLVRDLELNIRDWVTEFRLGISKRSRRKAKQRNGALVWKRDPHGVGSMKAYAALDYLVAPYISATTNERAYSVHQGDDPLLEKRRELGRGLTLKQAKAAAQRDYDKLRNQA